MRVVPLITEGELDAWIAETTRELEICSAHFRASVQ